MSTRAFRERVVIGALLVVLAVVIVVRRGGLFTAPSSEPGNPTRPVALATSKAQPVADVRLELLQSTPADLDPPTRNPFQFRARAVAAASRPPAATGRGPVVVAGPPAPAPGPPPLPPIALKYIGVLETGQGKVAVFKDAAGEIINGGEGDILDGRYRLLNIGVESADLAYADGRGRQTIRLSGQ